MLNSAGMMRLRYAVPLLFTFALACGDLKELPTGPDGEGPADPNATFTRVQSEIFTARCTTIGCHDALGQSSGLVLTPDRSYSMLVNVTSVEVPSLKRVQPRDHENSYLYRKIVGTNIVGDRMPLASTPLTENEIKLVRDWIRRGAPND